MSLKRDQFSWWVRQQIGSVMTGQIRPICERSIQIAMTAPTTTVSVPANFVETFMVVADFCLQQDPLHNQAVPTNRIKKLWEMVEGGAAWNQQYYQIVRERLHRMGVIEIVDRQTCQWQSMAMGSWEIVFLLRITGRSRGNSESEVGYGQERRGVTVIWRWDYNVIRNYKLHNTLYHDAVTNFGTSGGNGRGTGSSVTEMPPTRPLLPQDYKIRQKLRGRVCLLASQAVLSALTWRCLAARSTS